MLKRSLIILFIIFSILFISNVCLANNTATTVKNVVNSGTNTVVDGISNLASDVRNGVGNLENGIEDALTMDDMNARNDDDFSNAGATTTDNYTATRTATTREALGATGADTTTMWVWVILAVAAITIVGLVWYYGSQNRVD